jgi:DNA-binding NarL/FixJ family response regulator
MDITIPIMTGINATHTIHAEMPGVCVIGLSMFLHDQQAEAMRDAGAMD